MADGTGGTRRFIVLVVPQLAARLLDVRADLRVGTPVFHGTREDPEQLRDRRDREHESPKAPLPAGVEKAWAKHRCGQVHSLET